MMTKKERQQLYEENRPYYGYTMKEWSSFNYIPVDQFFPIMYTIADVLNELLNMRAYRKLHRSHHRLHIVSCMCSIKFRFMIKKYFHVLGQCSMSKTKYKINIFVRLRNNLKFVF